MTLRHSLLSRIDQHCREHNVTDRQFGYAAVQDGRLVERLREGKGSLKLVERVEAYLDAPAKVMPAVTSPQPAEVAR